MYSFDSRVRFSEVDETQELRVTSLINFFQDCSTFQSESIGLGIDALKEYMDECYNDELYHILLMELLLETGDGKALKRLLNKFWRVFANSEYKETYVTPLEQSLEQNIYGKGTDLGTALQQLCEKQPAALNGATTLLILSDTKTIDQPRAVAALLEAKRQAGRVIWLNPIPESKWKYVKSIQAMASICTMVPCSTLRELAAACRRLTQA